MGIALGVTDLFAIICAAITSYGIWALSGRAENRSKNSAALRRPMAQTSSQTLIFDFDTDGRFLCVNDTADHFVQGLGLDAPNWSALRAALLARFPDLPITPDVSHIAKIDRFDAISPADPAQATLETHKGRMSLRIASSLNPSLSLTPDAHAMFTKLPNLDIFQTASEGAPYPVWIARDDGRIRWSNVAYKQLDSSIYRADPKKPLFDLPKSHDQGKAIRVSIRDHASNTLSWYAVTSVPFKSERLCFAQDIHDVITAEAVQHNFVQTLAKTFAHLSTGLAVFDRNRELVLFNPALIDLTKLQPEFLSKRPNLFSVFDELRNSSIMPEPKNYANWRERVSDVMSAANDGNFRETWALPTGQTYRVTGRPHPDGAIAFLFEDISAEISLTRRFRGEMDITQSALNALPDSIAIFSPSGELIQCNETMMAEWDLPDAKDDKAFNVVDISRQWQRKCRPSPIWGDIRDAVVAGPERAAWTGQAQLKHGNQVDVQVSPIAAGSSLVTLRIKPKLANTDRQRKSKTKAA